MLCFAIEASPISCAIDFLPEFMSSSFCGVINEIPYFGVNGYFLFVAILSIFSCAMRNVAINFAREVIWLK